MVKSLVVLLATLAAHPLHTSYTEIARDAKTGTVSISVKLFADDFGVTLDSLARATGVRLDVAAQAYFERSVSIVASDGKPVRLAWCGMQTADGFTRLCARSAEPVSGKLGFRNALMFDRFPDQISIVRWNSASGSGTFALTSRSPELRVH